MSPFHWKLWTGLKRAVVWLSYIECICIAKPVPDALLITGAFTYLAALVACLTFTSARLSLYVSPNSHSIAIHNSLNLSLYISLKMRSYYYLRIWNGSAVGSTILGPSPQALQKSARSNPDKTNESPICYLDDSSLCYQWSVVSSWSHMGRGFQAVTK